MYILGDCMGINIAAIAIAIVTSIILYYKYIFNYWSKKNVISYPPTIPFGNFTPYVLQKVSLGARVRFLYNELKKKGPFGGIYIFGQPVLLLLDPEICKVIMTKDFQYFDSRNSYRNEKNDPLSGHLLNLNGTKWKNMRSKLTPTFTSGKMKNMFQTIAACSEELQVVIDQIADAKTPIEVKDLMGRFTTDIIVSCAFGIECNSLKDPKSIFREKGKKIFDRNAWAALMFLISDAFPTLFSLMGFTRIPKDTLDFFMKVFVESMEVREKNEVSRKDFLQLLLQLKNKGFVDDDEVKDKPGNKLTMNELAAQAFVFFLAGFETSSTTLSSTMYELATHQDVQDKVRQEINEVIEKHDGKLTYDALMEMTYLEKVVEETMRLHSTAPIITRECTADYKMPNSDVIINSGTRVMIPVQGFHLDPEIYPKPEVFDPERFSAEEKAKRHQYSYLPFGAGPRNCIGLRFGQLQIKVGLVSLLKNHKYTLNSKTQTPLKENPKCDLYAIIGGIWVNAEKIT